MERKKFEIKYNQLVRRIDGIKKHFDFSVNPNGPTAQQSDKIRGMLVLCHAEFENHIENLALLLIDDAYDKWKRNKNANYNLASLLVHSNIEKNLSTDTKIGKAVADYRNKLINNNHGVKEHNISTIFTPLGYEINDFDSVFISTLDSFGSDRGVVAHTSAKTSSMYDKATEVKRIEDIVSGLSDFQDKLLDIANNK